MFTAGGKGERSAIKPALVMKMLWLCCENEEMTPKKRPKTEKKKTESEDPVGYAVSAVFVCRKDPRGRLLIYFL